MAALRPSKKKRAIPSATRMAVAERHGVEPGGVGTAQCAYCDFVGNITWYRRRDGRPSTWVHFQYLELDHVYPESKGGGNGPDNIVLACRPCNRAKKDKVL